MKVKVHLVINLFYKADKKDLVKLTQEENIPFSDYDKVIKKFKPATIDLEINELDGVDLVEEPNYYVNTIAGKLNYCYCNKTGLILTDGTTLIFPLKVETSVGSIFYIAELYDRHTMLDKLKIIRYKPRG